jgi:methyl coenzyme M reductase subunit D
MTENKIQTLHPEAGKINKIISIEKYEMMKTTMLEILQDLKPTHTELMEELYTRLNTTFTGNVQWYGETVKLDLEARGLIQRSNSKPQKYSLCH